MAATARPKKIEQTDQGERLVDEPPGHRGQLAVGVPGHPVFVGAVLRTRRRRAGQCVHAGLGCADPFDPLPTR